MMAMLFVCRGWILLRRTGGVPPLSRVSWTLFSLKRAFEIDDEMLAVVYGVSIDRNRRHPARRVEFEGPPMLW